MRWHLERDIKDPSAIAADIPPEFVAIVIRCCRTDPNLRYRNVGQILYDLRSLADKLGLDHGRREPEKLNMMNLFLVYRQEQQPILRKIVKDFSRELEKVGARLRGTDFKDLLD